MVEKPDGRQGEPVKAELVPTPTHQIAPNGKKLFAKGNNCSRGNPHMKQFQKFQKCVLNAVTIRELREVVKALIRKAVDGDVLAAKLLIERTCGKIPQDAQVSVTNVNPGSVTICIKQEDDED